MKPCETFTTCQNIIPFINDNVNHKNYKINLNNHIYMLYSNFFINKMDLIT